MGRERLNEKGEKVDEEKGEGGKAGRQKEGKVGRDCAVLKIPF